MTHSYADKIPIYLNDQIIGAAKIYLEAADRCLQPGPHATKVTLDTCLNPAQNCAVVACELMLKSMNAREVSTPVSNSLSALSGPATLHPETEQIYQIAVANIPEEERQKRDASYKLEIETLRCKIRNRTRFLGRLEERKRHAHQSGRHALGNEISALKGRKKAQMKDWEKTLRDRERFDEHREHSGLVDYIPSNHRDTLKRWLGAHDIKALNDLGRPLQAARYPYQKELEDHLDPLVWYGRAKRLAVMCEKIQPGLNMFTFNEGQRPTLTASDPLV